MTRYIYLTQIPEKKTMMYRYKNHSFCTTTSLAEVINKFTFWACVKRPVDSLQTYTLYLYYRKRMMECSRVLSLTLRTL